MATKTKNKKTTNTKANNTRSSNIKKAPPKKEHGALLTGALILMALHGIVAAFAYNSMSTAPDVQRPWIIGLMVLHSVANIGAAALIYYWKKWGLYIYAASTVAALVAGLISVGMWSVFYMVLPLAILGWILRSKWGYFE